MGEFDDAQDVPEGDDCSPVNQFCGFIEDEDFTAEEREFLSRVVNHVAYDYAKDTEQLEGEHETINERITALGMQESSPQQVQEYKLALAEEKLVTLLKYPLRISDNSCNELELLLKNADDSRITPQNARQFFEVINNFYGIEDIMGKYCSLVNAIENALGEGKIADAKYLKDILIEDILETNARFDVGIVFEDDEKVCQHLLIAKQNAVNLLLNRALLRSGEALKKYGELIEQVVAYNIIEDIGDDQKDTGDYTLAKSLVEDIKKSA